MHEGSIPSRFTKLKTMKVEVKETQSNEVDWRKNPQLVVSDNGQVVIVSSVMDDYYFSGTQLTDEINEIGYYSATWAKKCFKPFHGTITLQND